MKHSTAAASRAGRDSPRVTRPKAAHGDAPLMRAACS